MSLQDLVGFFTDKKTNNGLDLSLQQGANFNSIQSRIESSVTPRLALIEQTTQPGIGSIVENFSGSSPEAPLDKINTIEYKQLQVLEDAFNKSLSEYTQKQNSLMNMSDKSSYQVKTQLDTMFKTLQKQALVIQNKTMDLHKERYKLIGEKGVTTRQKSATLTQLKQLQTRQEKLNKLMTEGDTLSAIVHDNTLQLNAAYMRYFVWFGAAVTLGLVAMHRATK